ncbi:growth factor receptor-bound protein 2-like [Littorina saxatilis]|uniref:Uncharacterized protein n=1 Tax=Littorina saxatilis TaxID=31220 RepID=A0AAN9BV56_9CAEN
MEATALYDFSTQQGEELPFRRGDVLKVLSMEGSDWYDAELNGKKGLIPSTYVQVAPHEWYKGKMGRAEAETYLMRTDSTGHHVYQDGAFVIRESESGKSNFSLSVKHGSCPQHFLIRCTAGGDYYLWQHTSFRSINKLIDCYRHTTLSQSKGTNILLKDRTSESQPEMLEALHDFSPETPDEVTFKRGDNIKLIERTDDGWWTGLVIRTGQQGLFPSTFVKAVR